MRDRVRLRSADQGAAALRARAVERSSLAAAALEGRRADRAGDHGRRRSDGRLDHAPHRRPRQRSRVPHRRRADPSRRHLRLARCAPAGARRRAARARPRGAARCSSSRRRRASPTRRRSGRATACWTPPGSAVELERVVRALQPHIGARVAVGRRHDCSASTALRCSIETRGARARRPPGEPGPYRAGRPPAARLHAGRARAAGRAAARRARDGRRRRICAVTACRGAGRR